MGYLKRSLLTQLPLSPCERVIYHRSSVIQRRKSVNRISKRILWLLWLSILKDMTQLKTPSLYQHQLDAHFDGRRKGRTTLYSEKIEAEKKGETRVTL
ncbi:hypothetical protein POVCU2_0082890 [Plasmodium ovale curtisi]|uniref:Uncharacterized protein n=1 Tax=Plasmodium ovale curtisi TaxID=864141 RepID=A0A1A8VWX5_PLAOA|nr:hypothetical protein POVCU1_008870 [Plasmodium ovale curtisi]SBS93673.1 hypothetical protein POVCU2_0082890 [Plasmodium ovale curtisi]